MSFLDNLLNTIKAHGASKEPIFDGEGYEPSEFSRILFVSKKTDYDKTVFNNPNTNPAKKIMVICTEEKYLTMNNGKKFSTGNHPVEMLVPMLHLQQAGFEADIFTPTGRPVQFEMWAFPTEDEAVQQLYNAYKPKFENPGSLADYSAGDGNVEYVAVFIPGGHGALNGLPTDAGVKKVITNAVQQQLPVFTICHGPAALLAVAENFEDAGFPFKNYEINAFPDDMDKKVPGLGYTPGEMPFFFGDRLKALGVNILNDDVSGATHVYGNLITGDSPMAANKFGKLCAEFLLKQMSAV